jgi:DNA repair protein RadC
MKRYEVKVQFLAVGESGPAEKLCSPNKVVEYMKGAFDAYPEQESFYAVILNRKNYAKGRHLITLGTQSGTLAAPREVFRAAVASSAAGIICVHNHPSGDPAPSAADVQVTRQLRDAGKVLAIELLDHVIIGDPASDPLGKGYFSFREAGML